MMDLEHKWLALIDINVVLDVLEKREPHFADSARVWGLAERGVIRAMIAAHGLTTLYYLYKRHRDAETARSAMRKLLTVFSTAPVDGRVIEAALSYEGGDFEDAVQLAAAVSSGCDYLVTWNPKDFSSEKVAIISPAEFLAIAESE